MKLLLRKLYIAAAMLIMVAHLMESPVLAKSKGNTAVNIKIGKKTFEAVFYDNKTARTLLKKAPVKYKMSELNGNEKYKYLKYSLPVREQKVTRIKAGDIMLYGSDCLVVFYKSFSTSYSYTKIGRISNTKGLKKAAGKGRVTMRIIKKKR